MEQSANIKFCSKVEKTAIEMHEMKGLFTEIKLYFFICVFTWFKDLKDSERNTKTLKVIQEVGGHYRTKIPTNFYEILHAVEPFLRTQ
jgi:hypothetical protein